MISGEFSSFSLDDIFIDRDARQRKKIADIDDLATSLATYGLLHPVIITREGRLVAGERRCAAAKSLGWTHVTIQYLDQVDPLTLKSIELEENIKRKNILPQEESAALNELHELEKSKNPDWTMADTAEKIGVSTTWVEKRILVARNLDDPRVAAADNITRAANISKRIEEHKAHAEMESIIRPDRTILNEDFLKWAPTYAGPKFNFIHCDFPYGINADKFNQGSADLYGGYDDTPETFWRLLDCLADNIDRLAADDCHLMFWYPVKNHHAVLSYFERTPFKIDPVPLIWHRSDNVGIIPDYRRGPRRVYETCLFGRAGDPLINEPVANLFAYPSGDSHQSEKPEEMLRHFFRMFVNHSTRILDPTCGSGSALRAARFREARHIVGLEINKEFAAAAERAFMKDAA